MTLIKDEFGLSTHNKSHQNFDMLEKDSWIENTGASTHTTNSDKGMFNCVTTTNQYIEVGSGEMLQIVKKECQRITVIQKSGNFFK